MGVDLTLIGPPGTGKTTYAVRTTTEWFKDGSGYPENTAYLAFTRAAAQDAASRVRESIGFTRDEKLPYFRTIHSMAYRILRQEREDIRLISTYDMKRFAKETGYDGAYVIQEWEDMNLAYQQTQDLGLTDWDKCLSAYTLSRISIRHPDQIPLTRKQMSRHANRTVGFLEEDVYRAFVEKYEAYKERYGLIDFCDMLIYALMRAAPIDNVKYAVVDEAQDLSPIAALLVNRWFSEADVTLWCGDPDQAIFTFSAADAQLFIDRANRTRQIKLHETKRFGQDIVDFSREIISRVKNRIECPVIGVPGRHHVIRHTGAFKPVVAPMLLLHRHVRGCQALAAAYVQEGLPFRNERGRDPLGYGARVTAFHAMNDLADGRPVTWAAVGRLVGEIMPSIVVSGDGDDKLRLVVHGGKKKLQEDNESGRLDLRQLVSEKVLTEAGADVIRQKQFSFLKHSADLEYYHKVLENGYMLSGEAPIITTIHGAKGRQAKDVVVFSEMGERCWEDAQTEHRLAYVAATRTENSLEICAERTLDWAEYQYNYPKGNQVQKVDET